LLIAQTKPEPKPDDTYEDEDKDWKETLGGNHVILNWIIEKYVYLYVYVYEGESPGKVETSKFP
jgi:hypothetical protein